MDAETAAALIAESAKRSGLIWVRRSGSDAPARPVWHAWHEGSVYLLTGGIEQPTPEGLLEPDTTADVSADVSADVIVRSKDNWARLVVWRAAVTVVAPNTEQWDSVLPILQAKRLNSPDGEAAPGRWATDCVVLRLTPNGEVLETPDDPSTASHAGPPVPTSATTPVPRPWHLFGRSHRASR